MEQKKINIAELLKDAPKGTKLYSPIFGKVELITPSGEEGYIEVADAYDEPQDFLSDGKCDKDSECLLFPSKEVRDWGCFRVKYAKGVAGKSDEVLELLESNGGTETLKLFYTSEERLYYIDSIDHRIKVSDKDLEPAEYGYILSTGTELKLGEQPKFKVGDVVKADSDILGNNVIGAVESTEHCGYKNDRFKLRVVDGGRAGSIDIPIKDNSRLAADEEIAEWNKEVLEPNHLHYSKSKRKIIHWFLPFDRVVVKDFKDGAYCAMPPYPYPCWKAQIFSYYNKHDKEFPYVCLNDSYPVALPYNEETAKLIGTTDDCGEE